MLQPIGSCGAHTTPHLCALNSFMISRKVSYTSFLSWNLFLTCGGHPRGEGGLTHTLALHDSNKGWGHRGHPGQSAPLPGQPDAQPGMETASKTKRVPPKGKFWGRYARAAWPMDSTGLRASPNGLAEFKPQCKHGDFQPVLGTWAATATRS